MFGQEITSVWICWTTATRLRRSWTCLLSIVVSRPVQIASHRGVIQESLVCTARHPTLMWNSQVFDSSTESYRCLFHLNLSWQHLRHSMLPAPVTRNQSLQLENFHQLSDDTSLAKYAKSQTQIGAKDVQSNLHSSNQSELCDVSSSWSAIRLQGAARATSTLEHPVTYLNNNKEGGKKAEQSAMFGREITSVWICWTTATRLRRSWTCLLSIVVSRPVQIASHRGVIQESLVCTARHPTLMWNSQVFDSSAESYRCLFQLNLSWQHLRHSMFLLQSHATNRCS